MSIVHPCVNTAWQPVRLVLDTDIGFDADDLLALAMVLDRPEFELLGIIACGGEPDMSARMARALCRETGHDVPVAQGEKTRLGEPVSEPHLDFFVTLPGFGDPDQGFSDAENLLASIGSRLQGALYVSIGPLTTLARLLDTAPELTGRLRGVVSMGGYVQPEGAPGIPEYNFGVDPAGTRKVLSRGLPHLCVTKNLCDGFVMPPENTARLARSGGTARVLAARFLKTWFDVFDEQILYDPLTLAIAADPGPVRLEPVAFDVAGDMTVTARFPGKGGTLATVGTAPADQSWFENLFYGAV
ncbi:MAG: nucleoside hydrolase [Desulfatibacillaceae bacterium]